jgi:hypothetical protein
MARANSGWSDPIGAFERLQTAVRRIARGKDNYRVRMDEATYALIFLRPGDVPMALRERVERILNIRREVSVNYVTNALFHFERLSPKRREILLEDILSLYEACLIDIGRDRDCADIAYPK